MIHRCVLCEETAARRHHLTGRGEPDFQYLDPDLTVLLCHDDHELVHEDLRKESVDKPSSAASALERAAFRLDRLGLFMGRAAETEGFSWLALLAAAVRRWASELRAETSNVGTPNELSNG